MKNTHISGPIRILLLDNHAVLRDALRLLLESRPGFEVVGATGKSLEAFELLKTTQADIVLLELNLDDELDVDIIFELLSINSQARIILLTGLTDPDIQRSAVQLGSTGVVSKKEPAATLVKAIEKVHAGEVWIDRSMMAGVLSDMWRDRLGRPANPEALKIAMLSEREKEVIRLVGEGLKNNQIAERLGISSITVRHHLTSIYQKLEVSDRLELTIYAYQNNLAELPA